MARRTKIDWDEVIRNLPPPPFAYLVNPPLQSWQLDDNFVRLDLLTRDDLVAFRSASTTDSPPSISDRPTSGEPYMLYLRSPDRFGNEAVVTCGTWGIEEDTHPPVDVVLKRYPLERSGDRLIHELDVYTTIGTRLSHTPSALSIIPTLHCIVKPQWHGWAGLLLEDAGSRIAESDVWSELTLSQPERIQLYETLGQLHQAGVLHGDLAPRNIVRRSNGDFCIIDFDQSDTTHVCPGSSTCTELVQFRHDLGL
ncbi:hypothetical protein FB45DRAFT_1002402 [Roridomyces roridus]|uniref:Aminoglycoside phosphotransferase domain-containing protein n=1 Tax=Roridomyces roridus TaxID=1738132 RepID=A0AAD7C1D2_9AGAR|nr:hypothetical protein FB45DRAFT_1002402 [Roridomyces roridus]